MEAIGLEDIDVGDLVSVWKQDRRGGYFLTRRFTHREKVTESNPKTFKTASGKTWLRKSGSAAKYGLSDCFVTAIDDAGEQENRMLWKMTNDERKEYLTSKKPGAARLA